MPCDTANDHVRVGRVSDKKYSYILIWEIFPGTSQCRVQCGFLSGLCPPVSCQAANPAQCGAGGGGGGGGGGSRCSPGYTDLGRVCVDVVAGPANYLSAITDCQRRGGSLVTVQSQQEQDALYALTGSTGAWIGLTDFLDEGQFSWVDGSPLTFTNFRAGQPNNANSNQHCTWIRPDGLWDDITCKKQEQYVCQKPPRLWWSQAHNNTDIIFVKNLFKNINTNLIIIAFTRLSIKAMWHVIWNEDTYFHCFVLNSFLLIQFSSQYNSKNRYH